jgi:TnpA family transposase
MCFGCRTFETATRRLAQLYPDGRPPGVGTHTTPHLRMVRDATLHKHHKNAERPHLTQQITRTSVIAAIKQKWGSCLSTVTPTGCGFPSGREIATAYTESVG